MSKLRLIIEMLFGCYFLCLAQSDNLKLLAGNFKEIPLIAPNAVELPKIRFAAFAMSGDYHSGFAVDVYSSHISVGAGQSSPSEITREPLFVYPDGSTVLMMKFYHSCASKYHYIRISDGYDYEKTIDYLYNGQEFQDKYYIGDKKNITISITLYAY